VGDVGWTDANSETFIQLGDIFDDPMDMMSPIADHLRWLEAAGYEAADAVWLRAGHAVYAGWRPAG
jgi:hypothetical protein